MVMAMVMEVEVEVEVEVKTGAHFCTGLAFSRSLVSRGLAVRRRPTGAQPTLPLSASLCLSLPLSARRPHRLARDPVLCKPICRPRMAAIPRPHTQTHTHATPRHAMPSQAHAWLHLMAERTLETLILEGAKAHLARAGKVKLFLSFRHSPRQSLVSS
jgi:hypothetical protein